MSQERCCQLGQQVKMTAEHVIVKCDVYCDWQDQPPVYRLYVNDELFAERTYIWQEAYLEERIPIYADPGKYYIKYELVPPSQGTITVKNMRITEGPTLIMTQLLERLAEMFPDQDYQTRLENYLDANCIQILRIDPNEST